MLQLYSYIMNNWDYLQLLLSTFIFWKLRYSIRIKRGQCYSCSYKYIIIGCILRIMCNFLFLGFVWNQIFFQNAHWENHQFIALMTFVLAQHVQVNSICLFFLFTIVFPFKKNICPLTITIFNFWRLKQFPLSTNLFHKRFLTSNIIRFVN